MHTNSNAEPRMSNPDLSNPLSFGKALMHMTAATMPIGTLMKKIQCQERVSVRIPPNAGPAAAPRDHPSRETDSPNVIFLGGRNDTVASMQEEAIIDAPMPCTALKTMSSDREPERPHAREDALNSRSPTTMTLRTAPLSQTFPKIRMRPAITRK